MQPRAPLLNVLIWLTAAAAGRRPGRARLHDGVGAGRMEHGEWHALLSRFVQNGRVDYRNMARVRRLVEVYLSRLAHENPDTFADADDQLAFYLNAFNTIAIHQVLLHDSARGLHEIAGAFTHVYPIGNRNVSLLTLHGNILRSFGEPRVHAAITLAALGSAPLQPAAFTGKTLQAQLEVATRALLQRAHYDATTDTLRLPALLRWLGGDFVQPTAMPGLRGLIAGWLRPHTIVPALQAYMPAGVPQTPRYIRFQPFEWRLNDQQPAASGRTIVAYP